MEIELEEAKVEISSRAALEVALCSFTTFCIASKWDMYKAFEELILFVKSKAAYKRSYDIEG